MIKKSKIHNIEPSRVALEILEDIITLTEDPHILSQINSLRSRGFKIALDDFGTQNSNFSRLLDFKPDYIKIDGIFIKDLQESKKSQIIVKTIVDFCKMSEIEVIAEYVHSEAVMKKVQDYENDYSQGYFIAEPAQELL
ncbi:MAG: EAL domain-containing protein [Campylobacterales bacterium]|nr:EAL domain-containing protein [Campylobacterales bacterium]